MLGNEGGSGVPGEGGPSVVRPPPRAAVWRVAARVQQGPADGAAARSASCMQTTSRTGAAGCKSRRRGGDPSWLRAAGAGGRRPEICLLSPSALTNSGTLGSELVQGSISLPPHPLSSRPGFPPGIACWTPADTKNLRMLISLVDCEILQPALRIRGFNQNLMRAVG